MGRRFVGQSNCNSVGRAAMVAQPLSLSLSLCRHDQPARGHRSYLAAFLSSTAEGHLPSAPSILPRVDNNRPRSNNTMEGEGMAPSSSSSNADGGDDSVRFEDLTVDDDLPLIDRLVRYCHSPVALQRLVHVKMLAEASELTGYVIWCLFVFVVVRFVAARRWRWWWCWPASLPHSAANPFPTRTTDYSCLPPSCPDPPCPALPCPALPCPVLCAHTQPHTTTTTTTTVGWPHGRYWSQLCDRW